MKYRISTPIQSESNIKCQISQEKVVISMGNWTFVMGHLPLQKGFTLIELLIYTGMLTVLLAVFTTLFGLIVDSQLDLEATSSVQQDNQYIAAKLSQDIMKADSIASPSATAMGQNVSELRLNINSIVYTYSLDTDGDFIIATSSANNALNSYQTTISDLSFTRIGNSGGKNSILFTYKVTSKTRKSTGYEVVTATSAAALR